MRKDMQKGWILPFLLWFKAKMFKQKQRNSKLTLENFFISLRFAFQLSDNIRIKKLKKRMEKVRFFSFWFESMQTKFQLDLVSHFFIYWCTLVTGVLVLSQYIRHKTANTCPSALVTFRWGHQWINKKC